MARKVATKTVRKTVPVGKAKKPGIIEKFLGPKKTGRSTASKKTSKFKKAK